MNEIKQPWCVYGSTALDLGKITGKSGNSSIILYSENQKYPMQLWDNEYVRDFDSLNSAIRYLIECTKESEISLKKMASSKFPSEIKLT